MVNSCLQKLPKRTQAQPGMMTRLMRLTSAFTVTAEKWLIQKSLDKNDDDKGEGGERVARVPGSQGYAGQNGGDVLSTAGQFLINQAGLWSKNIPRSWQSAVTRSCDGKLPLFKSTGFVTKYHEEKSPEWRHLTNILILISIWYFLFISKKVFKSFPFVIVEVFDEGASV